MSDDPRCLVEESKRTREMTLCCRGLPVVPPFAFTVKTLTRLDLSHNCLREVPEDIGVLKNLRELWLSHNSLEELPENLGLLLSLKSLDLQYNQLINLPESIGRLEKIVDLDLRNNPLSPKLAKRLFKKGGGRVLVKELKNNMFTCVVEDLHEIIAKIGQRRYDEDAERLTKDLIDEFGGGTRALAKLVRNAYTLIPRNLSEADAADIKLKFDARFQEAKGTISLKDKKKFGCGFPWIPTGGGTTQVSTYGDEFYSPEGIW